MRVPQSAAFRRSRPHRVRFRLLARSLGLAWLLLGLFSGGTGLSAPPAATGVIEGRVFDAGRGEFLENALVGIEGTSLETLTDAVGGYRLAPVPAGAVRLRVF